MSRQLVESIQERLSSANSEWPRHMFTTADKQSVILVRRLARAAKSQDVEFCFSSKEKFAEGSARFGGILFTRDMVIVGTLSSGEEYPPSGDVVMVPRSAIRSLTLHHVEYFGYDDDGSEPDYVSFTAEYDGMPPVHIGMPGKGGPLDGSTSQLFDALQADLLKAIQR